MGKPGPRPTPTAIQKARGTDRADTRAKNEPKPDRTRPVCPAWLDKGAKSCWKQIVPQLEAMGVLTRIDRNALTRYCRFWSRWKAAEISIEKYGGTYVLNDKDGKLRCIMQRPEVSIAHKLGLVLSRLEAEFGMTPSSRTRIEATPPVQKEVDNKSRFFGVVG